MANYFQSFSQEACRLNLLTESEFENLQLQSIQLLARQTERYTGGESSSVKVETAQSICQSIFYTIGIYLKSLPSLNLTLSELKQKPLLELYRNGQNLIKAQFDNAKQLFDAVRNNSISTDNHAYNDTIQNGIAVFFSSYDMDYGAHETPVSIDYPLCNDKMELVGVEYICDYLQKLYMENQFCKNFAQQDIHCLLRGYDTNDRLESIFISLKGNHPQPLVQFEDGQKIDDELFRTITNEIRECRYVSDKILIIQREIHSIADLVDILEAYCIFNDEFFEIFKSLGDTELALLLRKLPTHVIDTDCHFTENEKEWQNRLNCYLNKIDLSRKEGIRELAEKIDMNY